MFNLNFSLLNKTTNNNFPSQNNNNGNQRGENDILSAPINSSFNARITRSSMIAKENIMDMQANEPNNHCFTEPDS